MDVKELSQSTGRSLIVRRWAATWIDFIVMLLILVAADTIMGNEAYQATLGLWIAAALAYHPVLEGITGRTLGRYATDTIVVTGAGKVPGIPRAIVRTLLRWIEVNPFLLGGAPAGLVVLVNKNRQRLGDMLAGTYVVRASVLKEQHRGRPLVPTETAALTEIPAATGTNKPIASPTQLLVLDTNCFIDAFNRESSAYADVQRLLHFRDTGALRIAISKHSLEQLSARSDDAFKLGQQAILLPYYPVGKIEELLGTINELPGTFDDMRENACAVDLMDELAKRGADLRDKGALLDAIMAKAEAFVTSDTDLVADGPSQRLTSRFGIAILRPGDVRLPS